jgi:hypothetical protein
MMLIQYKTLAVRGVGTFSGIGKPSQDILEALEKGSGVVDLSNCDLTDIRLPKNLSSKITELDLTNADNVQTLVSLALISDLKILSVCNCDLGGISVPQKLSSSLLKLDLNDARNVPKPLILKTFESTTTTVIGLSGQDLEGVVVSKDRLSKLHGLDLSDVQNGWALIFTAFEVGVKHLGIGGVDFKGFVFPTVMSCTIEHLYADGIQNSEVLISALLAAGYPDLTLKDLKVIDDGNVDPTKRVDVLFTNPKQSDTQSALPLRIVDDAEKSRVVPFSYTVVNQPRP